MENQFKIANNNTDKMSLSNPAVKMIVNLVIIHPLTKAHKIAFPKSAHKIAILFCR